MKRSRHARRLREYALVLATLFQLRGVVDFLAGIYHASWLDSARIAQAQGYNPGKILTSRCSIVTS
eukprot:7520120-Pyramimonas_sp.AAC.1